jgi:threonine dehydrogenase-like Zn-dependent dehydrogenase
MSRHTTRQAIAREFGATDIVTERGEEGIARIKELTKGIGADAVLECVGTPEAMTQAIGAARPGGAVGYVGVPHGVSLSTARACSSRTGGCMADGRDYGLTQPEAAEVLTHLAFYTGWPSVFSALPVAKDVFDKRPR